MSKRRPIPPKRRFAVFQRDYFTCQYCGAVAPDVVLQCDHIEAVANGGANNIDNLITACVDCNMGKGASRLDEQNARAIHRLLQQGHALISLPLLKKLQVIQAILIERFGADEDNDHMSELVQLHGFGIDLDALRHFAATSQTPNKFWDDAVEYESDHRRAFHRCALEGVAS